MQYPFTPYFYYNSQNPYGPMGMNPQMPGMNPMGMNEPQGYSYDMKNLKK